MKRSRAPISSEKEKSPLSTATGNGHAEVMPGTWLRRIRPYIGAYAGHARW